MGRRNRLTLRIDTTRQIGDACLRLDATKKGNKLSSLVKAGQPTNTAVVISYRLKKKLKKGTCSIVCTSIDLAGNAQAKATKAKLKVICGGDCRAACD